VGRGSPLAGETRNVIVALFLLFHIKPFAAGQPRAFEREILF